MLTRGSHRSVRADFPHTVPQVTPSPDSRWLSVGVALTHARSSMPSACFPPSGVRPDAPLPSTGSSRVEFPRFVGTIRALRLPVARPAALRCLRLAVPWEHSEVRSRCGRVHPQQAGTWSPGGPNRDNLPWRRQDLPRSWGTPLVRSPCSSTPAGPTHQATSMRRHGPRTDHREGSPQRNFRGSITRLSHWLSTLRSGRYRTTTQDSLPATGQVLPDGLDYPQGSIERFQAQLMRAILLPQAFVAQGQSAFSH